MVTLKLVYGAFDYYVIGAFSALIGKIIGLKVCSVSHAILIGFLKEYLRGMENRCM